MFQSEYDFSVSSIAKLNEHKHESRYLGCKQIEKHWVVEAHSL